MTGFEREGWSLCSRFVSIVSAAASVALSPVSASADADLAQQLSNPVASLTSVPFQFNWDTGIAPNDRNRTVLNIQPVIPFDISDRYNLISRTIVPLIDLEGATPNDGNVTGMGDIVQSLFFSPKEPVGGWILGYGPVFLLPTATGNAFKSKQFGVGPTFVALKQQSGWTYGALLNHIWGVNNVSDRPAVNQTFLQPFLTYTTPDAWTFSVNTESSYDWTGEQWTVPINASVSKLVKFGKRPVSFQLGYRKYVEKPAGGPDWGLRFNVTFLFPK